MRARSAARRGPTPLRYCKGVASTSSLLDDNRVAAVDLDLFDPRGQGERAVEGDAVRAISRPGIETDDLLQHELRHRQAGYIGRLQVELTDAVGRAQDSGR